MSLSIREISENFKKSKKFRGEMLFDEPMKNHTTMKVGGNAELMVFPQDEFSAADIIFECRKNNVPLFVLGGGSNLVINDEGIKGVVLCTEEIKGVSVKARDVRPFSVEGLDFINECCTVDVTLGSGFAMDDFCSWCARYGITGMETFAGLPGSCGGASYMNARCYNVSTSDVLKSVEYIDFDSFTDFSEGAEIDYDECIKKYEKQEGDWDYKKSPFQKMNVLVTKVTFTLTGLDVYLSQESFSNPMVFDYIMEKNNSYRKDREDKGHFKFPSAGSVFKNNRNFGKPSGVIIDESGLKGLEFGGAQIAPWHGNFIINKGDARASDIKVLVDRVILTVKNNTGYELEPEIIFV